MYICVPWLIYMCVGESVVICVCVIEREREREGCYWYMYLFCDSCIRVWERVRVWESVIMGVCLIVCVWCVCDTEKRRETEGDRGRDRWYLHVCHDEFTCVLWLSHAYDVTQDCVWHLCVWCDSFIYVMWESFIMCVSVCVIEREKRAKDIGDVYTCTVTHSRVCRDSFTCVIWFNICACCVHVCGVTRLYSWCD